MNNASSKERDACYFSPHARNIYTDLNQALSHDELAAVLGSKLLNR